MKLVIIVTDDTDRRYTAVSMPAEFENTSKALPFVQRAIREANMVWKHENPTLEVPSFRCFFDKESS